MGNLKIQDGVRPPCWIAFAVYSRNYGKSNFEENKSNLVILAEIDKNLFAI